MVSSSQEDDSTVWFDGRMLPELKEKNCSFPKSANRDLLNQRGFEAGVVAQARSVLAWHSRCQLLSHMWEQHQAGRREAKRAA
ncbi:peroxisomal NADH pyrophosphatase NUDT12 isoform X1 [Lates japonicus]|uniref:Peroxisomal NADH pyrophosphatase NUDT12 isoform X1 n=1 Tax=Lates japonicus TaxID=270547 RepID=A0AAD3RL26_LATJO|nr:peroxisomal NADH pyrophosphatase NUDT12 isoform X1 [Lates japonicus]